MLLNPRIATSSTSSLMEEVSSNPPPHVQRCIEELRSLGVSVSRSRLYKEVNKARSPKLRQKRIMGIPLDQYEDSITYNAHLGCVVLRLQIPSLFGECLLYLEEHLHVKGLFRKSPAVSRLRELEISLVSGKSLRELQPPCHDVAGLVKSFLRSLPEPLFSEQILSVLTQCPSLDGQKVRGILLACSLLATPSLHCLQALLSLLLKVSHRESENKMNIHSLAVVIAPTLFNTSNSLKKPSKERATTQEIISVLETMLQHPEEMGRIQNEVRFEPDKNERRRTGSLSDMFKVFPRKTTKFRISSQPYPATLCVNDDMVGEKIPVIRRKQRTKRPLEKGRPLLTEAKRCRLLQESGTLREAIIRREAQIKENKLSRRNAFLHRRNIPDTTGADVYLNSRTAVNNCKEATKPEIRLSYPKEPYPFHNIRENLEFKFISEDTGSFQTLFTAKTDISSKLVPTGPIHSPSSQTSAHLKQFDNSLDSVQSSIQAEDSISNHDMIRSRTEESLELFANSLMKAEPQSKPPIFDSTPNFRKTSDMDQFMDTCSPFPPPRRVQPPRYFERPENRVHINDRDVLLPSSHLEIYISADGCSSTPINVLESPFRVTSTVGVDSGDSALPTQFGTIPLQRHIRVRDNIEKDDSPSHLAMPLFSQAQTEIPDRSRRPPFPLSHSRETSRDKSNASLTPYEISVDPNEITDSETPASFHRQNPIRRSFRNLLSPVLPMKRNKPETDKDSFEKTLNKSSSSSFSSSRRNKPQRRWSFKGMFKSPTPPRPVIHTTLISSPIPIKLPAHAALARIPAGPAGTRESPPIVKRACIKPTPPLQHHIYPQNPNLPAASQGNVSVLPEWVGSPPSIISSENTDVTSSLESNGQMQIQPKQESVPPDINSLATPTPSDNTSEDILRDDSFTDTSLDTFPFCLKEESPEVYSSFIDASPFVKPHMGAIKVLPDLPPIAPLRRTLALSKPVRLPRGNISSREDALSEGSISDGEDRHPVKWRPVIKRAHKPVRVASCVETAPLPDVADCVRLFEAMARPNSEARKDPTVRASFTGFNYASSKPLLKYSSSLREPDRL